jgi:hypothetical protein
VTNAGAARGRVPAGAGRGKTHAPARSVKPKPRKGPPPLTGAAAHAVSAFEAMEKYFYISGTALYREEEGATSNSFLWPFSQAIAATVSVAHIRGQQSKAKLATGMQMRGLQKYLSTTPPAAITSTLSLQSLPHYAATIASAGAGATTYYDDNDWVGIEMARLNELTHSEAALSLAEQILAFEEAGWESDAHAVCPGGIPHSDEESDDDRSTISTAPAAELAVQLYRITRNWTYLQFAEAAYNWVRQCLLTPSGLYADHIEGNGELDPELWSYTQGVMIGAGALLYQVTGNGGYLQQASATAEASLPANPLEILGAENPFFASVYLRNLIYLDSILRNPTGLAIAQQYVNWSWDTLHESNGLFYSAEGGRTTLLEQSAVAQVYALIATSPATYF